MRRSYTGMSVNKAGSVNSIGGTSRSQDGNGVGVAAMEEGERGAGGGWGGRGSGARSDYLFEETDYLCHQDSQSYNVGFIYQ